MKNILLKNRMFIVKKNPVKPPKILPCSEKIAMFVGFKK
ncbi:MAG: hypothetical protein K0S32_1627 [Bacteroidetes bacterium]|jgi:hypothetical protein|nr:hypothetical protein [Bacteroidota bacterium]